MTNWNENEDDYELIKYSLSKTLKRLRYLYYSLLLFLIALTTLFGVLLIKTPKRLVDISIVLVVGLIVIGLISAAYILFKSLLVTVPADKTKR